MTGRGRRDPVAQGRLATEIADLAAEFDGILSVETVERY